MASDIVSPINTTGTVAPEIANTQAAVMVPRGILPTEASAKPAAEVMEKENPKPIEDVVDNVNEYVQTMSRTLNFSIEKDTGQTVIKVVDSHTDELVRQIPSEEFLELAKALEKAKGILLRAEA